MDEGNAAGGAGAAGSGGSWREALSEDERARISRAGFGRRVGLGSRPAAVVIDVQQYMLGPPPGSPHVYPSACGAAAERAVRRLAALLGVLRDLRVPVFYSRFELARDGSDAGVYARKRGLPDTDGWCFEGTEGSALLPEVAPEQGDVVFVKKKPSAFFGTPLLGYLVDRGVDSLIVTGGSTSNCVRATAVDAASYNLRTIVVEDCVFDRFERSHTTALFDLDRQYGDVMSSQELVQQLRAAGGGRR